MLEVPTRAPSMRSPSRVTRTSRAEARSGTAAITRPSVSPAGRSFAEWTARSTSPSRSARTISATNSPFTPAGSLAGSAPRSPAVVVATSSVSTPDSVSASATSRACPRYLLQPHDRFVEQLGDDAAREGGDRFALLRLERRELGAEALELGVDHRVAAFAQCAEGRAEARGSPRG